jgi:hypothetical protein
MTSNNSMMEDCGRAAERKECLNWPQEVVENHNILVDNLKVLRVIVYWWGAKAGTSCFSGGRSLEGNLWAGLLSAL